MTSSSLADTKKILLSRLLDGVKGCQSRFGSRTELATEDEESVRKLCGAFEDVFLHGVKKCVPQASKGLWQMTENLVPSGLRPVEILSFWPLVKSQLSKHESERFLLLHHVRTDLGRSRAWVRAALNEHSLERYILIVLSLENLQLFYENWAFLRDPELSAILPQTAAGLGSVLFALSVDNPNLDKVERVMDKSVLEPITASFSELGQVAEEAAVGATSSLTSSVSSLPHEDNKIVRKPKKKKKKTPTSFVSFDDGESSSEIVSSVPSTCLNSPIDKDMKDKGQTAMTSQISSAMEEGSNLKVASTLSNQSNEQIRNCNPKMSVSGPEDYLTSKGADGMGNSPKLGGKMGKEASPMQIINSRGRKDKSPEFFSSSVKSADCLSIYSDCSDRLDNISLSGVSPSQRLKPVGSGFFSSRPSGGFDCSSNDLDQDFSQDLIPVPNFDASAELSPSDLYLQLDGDEVSEFSYLNATSPATPSHSEANSVSAAPIGEKRKSSISDQSIKLSSGSSKSDIPSTVDGNMRMEERLQKLKAVLDHEIEIVATLRAQLADEKRNSNDQIKLLETKSETLSKENEILKHQLKKYVGAVQMLKKEKAVRRTTSFEEEGDEELLNCVGENDVSSNEAAEYERKLIQVAEMHGELMEFNAHLQRSLKKKDFTIHRLREELVDLRGPLAAPLITGDEDDESWDVIDSSTESRSRSCRRIGSGLSNERVLINIWIPSAFLTGATNDLHHVYQVFLRIKDTEWNVYRRYSQFYSLHRDLKKRDTVIGSFYFPPKKHLGNKDAKFVDERRRKLQEFLRKVINYTLQTNSILASHPDKNLLISILPFFGELSNPQQQKPKRERSRSRNLFFRQSNTPQNQLQQHGAAQQQFHSTPYPHYTGL